MMRSPRPPIVVALLDPLNLIILGMAVAVGYCTAWWLFPVGLLLWLMLVVEVARDPVLRFNHAMRRRKPLPPRFQPYFERIEHSGAGIFNAVAPTSYRARRAFKPALAEVYTLTERTYRLCRRMAALEDACGTSPQSDLTSVNQQIETQLTNLANEMDNVLAEVLRTRAMGAERIIQIARPLAARVHQQAQELEQVAQAVIPGSIRRWR